jgi:glycosyltransferase involved in cell wall biosynthesis
VPESVPLFSICIPTFNRRSLLMSAIASALGQSYSNIEVIISDNASDDGTQEAVAAIGDSRIHYQRNHRNLGPSANWMKCLDLARGKYCSWLQDDDLLLTDFVASSVHALEEMDVACCIAACIYTPSPASLQHATVFTTALPLDWIGGTVSRLPFSLALPLSLFESSGIPPAMAFRTDTLKAEASRFSNSSFPLYNERLPLLYFAQRGGVALLPRILGIYRAHASQLSRQLLSNSRSSEREFRDFLNAVQRMADESHLTLNDFQQFLKQAPDAVVLRFEKVLSRAPRSLPLVAAIQTLLAQEIRRRPLNAPLQRAWRVAARWTPAFIKTLVS